MENHSAPFPGSPEMKPEVYLLELNSSLVNQKIMVKASI